MAGRIDRLIIHFVLLGLWGFAHSLVAQIPAAATVCGVELASGLSHVIRHSDELLFPSPGTGFTFQAGLVRQVSGKESWHSYWKNPKPGIQFLYSHFGNNQVLGQAFGCFPSLRLTILPGKKRTLDFEIGSGIAHTTKYYNKLSNPTNNALSTPWNNVTQVRWLLTSQSVHQISWFCSAQLTHFSNGHFRLPNKGINQAGLSVGVFLPYKSKTSAKLFGKSSILDSTTISSHDIISTFTRKRWGAECLSGIGFTEYSFEGGPPYHTYFFTAAGSYQLDPHFGLLAGAEFEFNQSTFQFYYLDFEDKPTSLRKASRTSLFGAAHFRLGRVSVRSVVGGYLPFPRQSVISAPVYFKLGLEYDILRPSQPVRPFVGVHLKSHAAVAQYVALVLGIRM